MSAKKCHEELNKKNCSSENDDKIIFNNPILCRRRLDTVMMFLFAHCIEQFFAVKLHTACGHGYSLISDGT